MTSLGSINWFKSLQALAGACAALLLISCGSGGGPGSVISSSASPTASAAKGVSLTGVLHGGQAPIVGSSLVLYAAGVPASALPSGSALRLPTPTVISILTTPARRRVLYFILSEAEGMPAAGAIPRSS